MRLWRMVLSATLVSIGAMSAQAAVTLPPVIDSHMVLQHGQSVPVWGTAASGEEVTVKFRDQVKSTKAGADGKWSVKLDALKVGGPDVMTVSGSNTITLDDVLVGEVWVGSGQSNMQGTVSGYAKSDPVLDQLAKQTYPKLRLMRGARSKWAPATPDNNGGASAILFAFGVRLQEKLDVPVGIMVGAVGGTPSGYWLTAEHLAADAPAQQSIKKFAETYRFEMLKEKHKADLAAWEKQYGADAKAGKKVPGAPPEPQAAGECRGKIGNLYEAHIRPYQPFAIRGVLWDQGESGTAITGLDQYYAMGALIRGWRNDWGQGEFPFLYVQKQSGGGCAFAPQDPVTDKGDAFSPLPKTVPATQEGMYRELHQRIAEHPRTAMVGSTDLGPGIHPTNKSGYGTRAAQVALGFVYAKDVAISGPTYKSHTVDGEKVRIQFDHVRGGLLFKHGDKLQGFAVSGDGKTFHWADAVIDGETVVVSCAEVKNPTAVRYAWGSRHPWANLFNKDGLPANAFRTDK